MIFIQTDFPECSQYQMPDNQTASHSQPIFDQKNHFNHLTLVQSKIEQFSLKNSIATNKPQSVVSHQLLPL